jgi:hypothetical protein
MQKLIILLGFFVLNCAFHLVLSQNKLYISPILNFKRSIAFVDPEDLNNNIPAGLGNQYFYQPYAVAYSTNFVKHLTFGYGLSLAYSFRNDTRLLNLTYTKDAADFGAHSTFRPYNSEIHTRFGSTYYGIGLKRINLDYSMQLSKKRGFLTPWLHVGLGCYINTNSWTTTFPFSFNTPLNPNGDLLLLAYIQPFEERRINGLLKLGLSNDFYIKNHYWFSLNAYYIQGFGTASRIEFVHEYLLNSEVVKSGVGLMSRGSGFYFEISRRFKIFTLKK